MHQKMSAPHLQAASPLSSQAAQIPQHTGALALRDASSPHISQRPLPLSLDLLSQLPPDSGLNLSFAVGTPIRKLGQHARSSALRLPKEYVMLPTSSSTSYVLRRRTRWMLPMAWDTARHPDSGGCTVEPGSDNCEMSPAPRAIPLS